MTALQRLLGIDLPIIQAPMAGVQVSALAVAVSNAGGLGSLPCAMLTADVMQRELAAIRAQTDKPFNVNFFCHVPPTPSEERQARWHEALAPYFTEFGIDPATIASGPGRMPFTAAAADLLAEFKPPIVSFHFGLPSAELMIRLRSWGAKIIASATTVTEARWLEAHGVDAVIAQGNEAGGHRGNFLSSDLTTQVGIADAKGVQAALSLGATAAQIGTAFLLCPEATTSALHREALKSEAATHTALTNVFTGRPARGIVNRIMRELGPISAATPEFPLATAAIGPLRAAAATCGGRKAWKQRLFAAMVRSEFHWMQRDRRSSADA